MSRSRALVLPLSLLAAAAAPVLAGGASLAAQAAPAAAPSIVGTWQGALQVSAIALRLVLSVERADAGRFDATLVSLDQGGARIPATGTVRGDSVQVTLSSIGGGYRGVFEGDSAIAGEWTQGGNSLPLRFSRTTAEAAVLRRPQEPRGPVPYAAEDVTFASDDPAVRLAGTLTLPAGPGPHPAVVLISGSGAQNRDEELLSHKPFLVIADHLTRRGIAVLRFDDRGVGRSTGDFAAATSADFARDALGAVRYLKTRPEIAGGRIGLAGHSEGGLVAPMVAVKTPDVAFLVLLAGPGLPGDSIIKMQGRLIMQAAGTPTEVIDRAARLQARMFAAVAAGGDTAATWARLRQIGAEYRAGLTPEEQREYLATEQMMDRQVQQLMSPWFRFFLTYDPRPALRRLTIPVLALNGGVDLQVPPKEDLAEIEAALRAAGNRDFRVVELPGLNHLFQTSKTGAPSEYGTIEETFSPTALQLMSDWILERFGPGK